MLDFNFTPFPQLDTERLTLRQMRTDDAGELFYLRSHKGVMEFIKRPLAQTITDALLLVKRVNDSAANNESITWAIALKDEPTLIGTIGYWRIDKEHHRAEIGYLLHPAQQRKGIMQEALAAVLDFGFNVLKLHTVEANVSPGNDASVQLLERNNFVKEGYLRENYYFDGKFWDTALYSLVAD